MSLAAFRIPRPKAKVRGQRQPDAVRLFYFAQLRTYLAKMHALVTKYVLPILASVSPDIHTDASDNSRIKAAIDRAVGQIEKEMPKAELRALAKQVFTRTSGFQKDQLVRQMQDSIGVNPLVRDTDLAEQASAFVSENVQLIQSVPERYFAGVQQKIEDGVSSGRRASEIAKDLEAEYGTAESSALLVANTEVGKLYGQLNQSRQEELGIIEFTWDTVKDGRVRDSHKDLDGQVFSWDDPPLDSNLGEVVIPGQAPNCRCNAIPVIEE